MFKDIPWYEWLYACDEFWNIFSYPKKFNFSIDWKLLKQCIWTWWYPIVVLHKNGKQKTYKVAHLVMYTFKWRRPDWMYICHNDSNKLNSSLNNLRYDTPKWNVNDVLILWKHPTQTNSNKWKTWKLDKRSKPILQFSKEWVFIKEWENAKCVKRELGYNSWHIASCCRLQRKSAHWFIWKFKPLPLPPLPSSHD